MLRASCLLVFRDTSSEEVPDIEVASPLNAAQGFMPRRAANGPWRSELYAFGWLGASIAGTTPALTASGPTYWLDELDGTSGVVAQPNQCH